MSLVEKWRAEGRARKASLRGLNRRVAVEDYLSSCASGVYPLPDKETCRKLAVRLGVEKDLWPDWVRKPLPKK